MLEKTKTNLAEKFQLYDIKYDPQEILEILNIYWIKPKRTCFLLSIFPRCPIMSRSVGDIFYSKVFSQSE